MAVRDMSGAPVVAIRAHRGVAALSTGTAQRAFGLMEIIGDPLPRILPRTMAVVCQVTDTRIAAAQLHARRLEVLSEDRDETPEGVIYVEQPFIDLDGHLIVLYHLCSPASQS